MQVAYGHARWVAVIERVLLLASTLLAKDCWLSKYGGDYPSGADQGPFGKERGPGPPMRGARQHVRDINQQYESAHHCGFERGGDAR